MTSPGDDTNTRSGCLGLFTALLDPAAVDRPISVHHQPLACSANAERTSTPKSHGVQRRPPLDLRAKSACKGTQLFPGVGIVDS
jgi:hypothetical protein